MSKSTVHRTTKVAAVLLIILATCTCIYVNAKAVIDQISITDTEVDIKAVKELLIVAQSHPNGPFPQNDLDPSIKNAFMQYYLKDNLDCWHAIQDAVVNNGSKYTISGSDTLRPHWRDVDNSFVEAQFQDGSKIGITFYQQMMVGCSLELP